MSEQSSTVTLTFLRHFQKWNPGEHAGFERALAEELCKKGVAIPRKRPEQPPNKAQTAPVQKA